MTLTIPHWIIYALMYAVLAAISGAAVYVAGDVYLGISGRIFRELKAYAQIVSYMHNRKAFDRWIEAGEPTMKPRAGVLAICSAGFLGMITESTRRTITYTGKTTGNSFVGIHLSPAKLGQPWASREPNVIGYLNQEGLLKALAYAKTGTPEN